MPRPAQHQREQQLVWLQQESRQQGRGGHQNAGEGNKGEDLRESVGVLTVLTVLTGIHGAPTEDDIMAEISDENLGGSQ